MLGRIRGLEGVIVRTISTDSLLTRIRKIQAASTCTDNSGFGIMSIVGQALAVMVNQGFILSHRVKAI
ncbi:hypothetical protein D3C86_990120 [compost metagenome]